MAVRVYEHIYIKDTWLSPPEAGKPFLYHALINCYIGTIPANKKILVKKTGK